MHWTEIYKTRLTTVEDAIRNIKNGDTVVTTGFASTPLESLRVLAANHSNYQNVTIYNMLPMGEGECFKPECHNNFCHLTNFVCAISRPPIWNGTGFYMPAFFKDVPQMIGKSIRCDVAIISTTPPDDDGFVSLGATNTYAMSAIENADIVIAEVNPNQPRTFGDTHLHISKIKHIVPVNYKLPELHSAPLDPVEETIGRHCATLIEDGSTLQIGIGAIPDAVLAELTDKHDLGIHTEMFSDGVMNLIEAGVITGNKKTLLRGKIVTTFVMGSEKLYKFVDNNPMVEFYSVDYINDPYIIGKNNKMVAINSCIEVDLQGQVASESMGTRQYSGTGGQVDFVRGAALSNEGKSIMAMRSTAAHGTISRIVSVLSPGAAVTTSRNDVDYVVTEYGIAHLKGLHLHQRAEALITIAHPDFRDKLWKEYRHFYNNNYKG